MMKTKTLAAIKFAGYACKVVRTKYANGQNALRLVDIYDGEPIAVASVCVPILQCADDEIFIKNYSENEGVLETLVDAGVVTLIEALPLSKWESLLVHKCKLLV